jgi:hypothetical protein
MTGFRYGDFPMAPYTLRRSVISLVARPKIINRTNGSLFAQATVATTPLGLLIKKCLNGTANNKKDETPAP